MDLSTYIETDFAKQRQSAARVNRVMEQAHATLMDTQDKTTGAWPYALKNRTETKLPRTFSESTAAMILHAVAATHGVISNSVLTPAVQASATTPVPPVEVRRLLNHGLTKLIGELNNSQSANILTRSRTWGDNDPLTLTWTYELARSGILPSDQTDKIRDRISELARSKIAEIAKRPAAAYLRTRLGTQYSVAHPFPLLRYIHLAKTIDRDSVFGLHVSELPEALLAQFHTELSNSMIQDAGFDPASLVFALEALLLINTDAVSEAMIDRVVDVLSSTPSLGSHWRPVRPLAATSQGLILLPQSVEVANAYLRICELAMREFAEPLFSRSVSALQAYADWIMSCAISIKPKYSNSAPDVKASVFTGWQSEHTYTRDVVHLWATSQVTLFLKHYHAMLDQHIARSSRMAAGLDFQPVAKPRTEINWEENEPMLSLPKTSEFRISEQVLSRFVNPRIDKSATRLPEFSILLYGPPGTGKTRFAKLIAKSLGYDLIIVTPSAFIRSGESGVEARAKELFDVLRAQSRTVILFDEIDRLLLDRDSARYETQADMFQFMTPSMLVKLNDLREEKRSIFIIATNYAERIDNAIKRPGRIDLQIPLLPPDERQRKELIRKFEGEYRKEQALKKPDGAAQSTQNVLEFNEDQVALLAHLMPLYIAAELDQVVRSALDLIDGGRDFRDAIDITLKQQRPSISLESYESRFYLDKNRGLRPDTRRTPWQEFALLAYICAEVEYEIGQELSWVRDVLNLPIMEELGPDVLAVLQRYRQIGQPKA